MLDTPQIVQTESRQTAFIHLVMPRGMVEFIMDEGIAELMAVVTTQGIGPAGPLFSYHQKIDPEMFFFDLGVPVTAPVRPTGRVKEGILPASNVARAVYQGPYEGIGAAWGELNAWIGARGFITGPNAWESYLAGPESSSDPAAWRTELNRPLLIDP